jgi:two-component system sensor histidine kinase DesK
VSTVTTTLMSNRPFDDPRRRWAPFFAGLWLLYLVQPFSDSWKHRSDWHGWVGMVATVAFAAVYVGYFFVLRRCAPPGPPLLMRPFDRRLVPSLIVEIALGVVMCVSIGVDGLTAAPYLAVMLVIWLPNRYGWLAGVLLGGAAYVLSATIPGWGQQPGVLFGTCIATLAVWGISQAMSRAMQVAVMREENAELVIQEERNRFARDLHDILGHSLTVVTVKAELAGRLMDVDPARAKAELADLERLSRDALADVRRAVSGYREITLPGELARARSALDAAGICATLPNTTDEVPGDLRELFAWTVREGVTNVLRHSGAERCEVVLSAASVEVRDDGRGADEPGIGHGLLGLRERAAELGAVLTTRTLTPGFSLKVSLP